MFFVLKGILLFIAIILLAVFTVIALLLFLTKSRKQKGKTVWMTIFIVSIMVTIVVAVYTFRKVSEKTADLTNKFIDKSNEFISQGFESAWLDNRNYLLDSNNIHPQTQKLIDYVPDSVQDTVNTQFFTYFGFRNWFRFPLTYPYAIYCIDTRDYGKLADDSRVIDFNTGTDDVEYLNIQNITKFNYDKNYLLAKLSGHTRRDTDISADTYLLFNFNTREEQRFETLQQLMENAQESGFSGDTALMTIKEYDVMFY